MTSYIDNPGTVSLHWNVHLVNCSSCNGSMHGVDPFSTCSPSRCNCWTLGDNIVRHPPTSKLLCSMLSGARLWAARPCILVRTLLGAYFSVKLWDIIIIRTSLPIFLSQTQEQVNNPCCLPTVISSFLGRYQRQHFHADAMTVAFLSWRIMSFPPPPCL